MSSKLLIGIAVICLFVGVSPAKASVRGGGGAPGAAPQDGKKRPRVEAEAEDISGRTIDRAPSDDRTPAPLPENVSAPAPPPKADARPANGRVNTRRQSRVTTRTIRTPVRANQRTNKPVPPLPPLFAVTLVTETPHAAVFVNGQSKGLAGADGRLSLQLKSGRYQVLVRPQGKFAHTHDVMIGPGSTVHYVVQNSPVRIKTFATNTKKN